MRVAFANRMASECLNSLEWKENGFSRALNGFQTNFCDFEFPNKYMNSKFQRYCLVCKIAETHRSALLCLCHNSGHL